MSRYLFDVETDGFLEELTKVHSLVLRDVDTGEVISCADQPSYVPVETGVRLLMDATEIAGHNIIRFDVPALKKVYPWFKPNGLVTDTIIVASVSAIYGLGSPEQYEGQLLRLVAGVDTKHRAVLSVMRQGLVRQIVLDYRRDYSKE